MAAKINLDKLMEAKGNLELSITQAIARLISDWKKENNAEITSVYLGLERVDRIGQQYPEYVPGFTTVDILTADGAKISSNGITYPIKTRKMDGKYR